MQRVLLTILFASTYQFVLVLLAATLCCIGTFVALRVPFVWWGLPEHIQSVQPLHVRGHVVFGSQIVSGQLAALWLSSLVLGQRHAGLAVGLFLALGFGGLCIFSGGGGFGQLQKPTLGYLLAMWVAVMAMGNYPRRPHFGWVWFSLAWGTLVVYGCGLCYESVHMALGSRAFVPVDAWWHYVGETLLVVVPGQLALMTVIALCGAGVNKVVHWFRAGRRAQRQDRFARAIGGGVPSGD